MPLAYYIYYRVAAERSAECEKKVGALLDAVRTATGIGGRFMKKRGEPLLWMEVYEGIDDSVAFERALAAAVAESGFADCLQSGSGRRTECFESAYTGP
ncbi:MAG: DUF4936 family protein [Burkholderiales bacterium]